MKEHRLFSSIKFFKRINLMLAFLLISAVSVFAENSATSPQEKKEVTGIVLDEKGAPIQGAGVLIVGTYSGVSTDADGRFNVGVALGTTLEFSFIGYESKSIVVGEKSDYTINMIQDSQFLEEVVVIGYGSTKRESITGSVSTLKADKLMNVTSPSVENMLTGKAAGVYVSPGSGLPGEAGKIIIRGKSTINGSTDPLWVIDGVIVGSNAGGVNPADIESMTILKDAASTAIYGSQGANGVIVVTTKGAEEGKIRVTASMKVGITTLHNGNLEVMDGAQLYDLYDSFTNSETIAFSRWNEELRNSNFDWWEEATQVGIAQDYNVSISGGTEQLKSYFSLGFYDETGAVKGYDYEKYSFRLKSDFKPTKWLTIKPSVSGSIRDVADQQYSVTSMYSHFPWDDPYDENGDLVPHKYSGWVNSGDNNYLRDLQYNHKSKSTYDFMGNLDFDVQITDWLKFSSINNFKWQGYSKTIYTDPRSSDGEGVDGRIEERSNNMQRMYTNQLLTFNKQFGDHSLNVIAGYEFNDYRYKTLTAKGTGFAPGFEVLDVVAVPEDVEGGITEWAVQTFLSRANYSYKNRYLVEASYRLDGASNFGANARYGNFASVSAGWNITQEDFFNIAKIDELKLRASYGSVGNRPNALYPQYDLYSIGGESYNGVPGALISQIGDPGLTWESTVTAGVGLDFVAFESRLRVSLDYYNKQTNNLLYNVPISGITGVTAVYRNVGEVVNNGFEAMIGGDIIRTKDWRWAVDATVSLNRNEVTELYEGQDQMIIGGGSGVAGGANRLLTPGMDADTWYMPEWAGVDTETGAPTWWKTVTDADGNKTREVTMVYNEALPVTMGAYTPKVYGGFSTDLSWKNLDLSAVFGYSIGGEIYNYSRLEYDSDGAYNDRNQMVLMDDWSRWANPGDIATHPVASYGNKSNSNKVSSRFLEDGSYLKLRSLTIGYNLNLKDVNLRIFFSGENLFTLTKFSGVDPELPPVGDDKVFGGEVGPGVYPSTRKFMFGINFSL